MIFSSPAVQPCSRRMTILPPPFFSSYTETFFFCLSLLLLCDPRSAVPVSLFSFFLSFSGGFSSPEKPERFLFLILPSHTRRLLKTVPHLEDGGWSAFLWADILLFPLGGREKIPPPLAAGLFFAFSVGTFFLSFASFFTKRHSRFPFPSARSSMADPSFRGPI